MTAPTAQPAARHRAACAVTGLIALAAFGPYVAGSVRTEQATVYGLLLAGLTLCLWVRLRPSPAAALILTLLATETLIAALGLLLPAATVPGFAPGSPLAGLDNLLLPPTVVLIGLTAAACGADPGRLVHIVCRIVVWAMCGNVAVAYASSTTDLAPLLARFWGPEGQGPSVAAKAATMGRYSGIFNQPAEAGALYAIAALAAIYLYRDRPLRMGLITAILTVGGVLSISKVFLLIGLPVAAWQTIRVSGPRLRRWAVLLTGGALITGAVESGLILNDEGGKLFGRLLTPEGNGDGAVSVYTAGRFGGDGPSFQQVVDTVMHWSPWFGVGARGLRTAYDNAWVEALVMAGLAGAVIYIAVLAVLVAAWWDRRHILEPALSALAAGLVAVLIGASFGLPALTANRVATVAWLLITLLMLTPRQIAAAPTPTS